MAKYLDSNGLSHFMGKVKAAFLTGVAWDGTNKKLTQTKNGSTTDVWTPATVASSGSYADLSNKPTIPSAGTGSSYPAMDGTRSLGSNDGYARVDHVHPTDTSRAAATHTHTAGDITSGTFDVTMLPVGTSASTVAQGNHTHGNITNGGDITASAPTIASGDKLIINDESASKITNGPSFGSDTTKYLRNDGTWATPPGEVNVQSDWQESSSSSDAYIKNKPTLGEAAAKGVDTSISSGSSSTDLPTTAAVAAYVASQITGAATYMGVVLAESDLLNVALQLGWYYVVAMPNPQTTSVTIGGKVCEAGDMIFVNTSGTYTTSSDLGAAIDVVQNNIETLTTSEIDALWTAA